MKHILTLAGIVLAGTMAMTSCSKNYKKTDNGIVVTTTDKQQVRLQVVSPTIIRVTATVEDEFSKKESLVVLPQEKCDDWNVTEENGFVSDKPYHPRCHAAVGIRRKRITAITIKSISTI